MSIFESARQGTLTGDFIDELIAKLLDGQDPDTGLTPLATAAVEGFPDEVEVLLKKGAKADSVSQNDATPLLLASWKGKKKETRPLIVQLLLQKLPSGSGSVDKTCSAANGKTPLIFAVERRDAECVRMLRKAGASLQTANGLDAQKMAEKIGEKTGDWSILLALDAERDRKDHETMTETAMDFLVYILAWANNALDGIVRKNYGLNPTLAVDIGKKVNYDAEDGDTKDKEIFVENVEDFLKNTAKGGPIWRFFGGDRSFVVDLARKVVNQNVIGTKTINQALYQHVIYCDDSSSMKRQGRWENQKRLVERLTKITTRVLPVGESVTLRFINRELPAADSNLTAETVSQVLSPLTWQPGGDTPIGTNLRSKILKPLVYDKIVNKTFSRPLLVVVITDGMPEAESTSELADAILECGQKLKKALFPETCVKFVIGQIGTANMATRFLDSLRGNQDLMRTTYITSEKLDAEFVDLKIDEKGLDRWLIENLFSPFQAQV